jgi:hypothetical protein
MKRNSIILIFFLLTFFIINVLAQNNGGGGGNSGSGGTTKIWEPDLVELWIYWHKTQYKMFTDFANNEDSLASNKYKEYKKWMEELAKVDDILFSQYQNNDVPRPVIFIGDVAYGTLLVSDIAESIGALDKLLRQPPVDSQLVDLFAESSAEILVKFAMLISSTKKVLDARKADNLRDNRFRDDLLNNIIKELEYIKLNLYSLYVRMRTGKNELMFNQLLKGKT